MEVVTVWQILHLEVSQIRREHMSLKRNPFLSVLDCSRDPYPFDSMVVLRRRWCRVVQSLVVAVDSLVRCAREL